MKIITYPKKKFDKMVTDKAYQDNDYFISIGYTREINDMEEGYDDPIIPIKYMGVTVKSVKPGFDIPEQPESTNFLRIKFDDVIEDFGPENIAFTKENAEEIFRFLKDAPKDSTIHVHCQAGQSRSAAVGVALKAIYNELGIEAEDQHESGYIVPNKTVLRIMWENRHLLSTKSN